jgi:nitrogen fixation/metabolism regulation signal transduction histidine kinase
MKLSLQHLQRTFDKDDIHAKEQLLRVSASIIEQIDALSKIANEFSSFAKLPKPKEEPIDLVPLIERVIEVFQHEGETAQVELKTEEKNCTIMGDKDLMIRVFNNLIKNALQAIPEDRVAKVEIDILNNKNKYLIAVADNGTGISEEMKDKIFVPNFTTKSTGTGLGLAMVKQIIVSHKGNIWFETSANVGTTFFIELYKH